MRKITSLMMLLCMFVATAWAQVPTASTAPSNGKWADGTKWYTIQENKSKYVSLGNVDANGYLMLNSTEAKGGAGLWCVVGNAQDGYQLYNYKAGTSKVLGAYGSEANGRMKMYDLDTTTDGSNNLTKTFDIVALEGESGYAFVKNHGSERDWWNNRNSYLAYWNSDYAYDKSCTGSQYTFVEVTDFEDYFSLETVKEELKAELTALKSIGLFSGDAAVIDAAVTEIGKVTASATTIEALNVAYESIEKTYSEACDKVYSKTVRINTTGRNKETGHDLVIDANGAKGSTSYGDAGVWTMSGLGNGTFALYNFVSNVYLGPTVGGSVKIPARKTLAEAGAYTFNLHENGKLNLINNGNSLHLDGSFNVVQWNDNNNESNQWVVTEVDDVVVSREVYDAAVASAAALPYAIQQAYGLVTDAAKFTSNAKEKAEGSYEALIDNVYNDPSYFHTSCSEVIGEHHYLQVEVSEGVKDFYFYFKKRQGNNNNRPIEIEIQGRADGQEFTTIKTISEGLPVDAGVLDYMSDVVNASATVKYIRFVVKKTNNGAYKTGDDGHPFFTFSEFYVLSSNNDVASLVGSYKAFASSSIQSQEMASAAEALINAESVLSLANIKKEIKSVIDANASNHAATPALGQYTTAGYNALKAAYEASDATQESLEKAIEDFRYAKNLPVFTIDGVVSYASGKSIYDGETQNAKGNTHYFKTTNLYDKTMWWALDLNTTTVGVAEEVGIYNVGTHKNFWNSSTIKITETNENDGAGITDDGIFLFYTTGNNTPIHYQNDGSLITRWASYDAASGSAHKFTYVGNTYELANLTDEKIQALAALKTAYDAKAYYKNAVVGDGLGQYKGNKDAIVAELAKAEAVYMKTISQQANMTVEEINAIAKSITDVAGLTLNMPETGFYRVKSLNGNDAKKAGKYWQIKDDETGYASMEAGTDPVKSIVYIKSNGETYNIVNYVSGLYLNKYSELKPAGTAAESWTIVENSAVVGAYALYAGKDSYCLSDWTGNITYGQKDANAAWTFEAVDVLPVAVTSAGYATLYAPVALTLADGVEAYYVSAKSASSATMTQVKSVVPANTAVLLKAKEGSYNLTIAAEAQAIEGNLLAGTVGSELVESEAFVLGNKEKGVGFYSAELNQKEKTAFVNNGFRAYLPAAAAGAHFLSFDFGTETSIENIEGAENAANAVIYNLSGRRVQKAQKGLYIVNGVKVIK